MTTLELANIERDLHILSLMESENLSEEVLQYRLDVINRRWRGMYYSFQYLPMSMILNHQLFSRIYATPNPLTYDIPIHHSGSY